MCRTRTYLVHRRPNGSDDTRKAVHLEPTDQMNYFLGQEGGVLSGGRAG